MQSRCMARTVEPLADITASIRVVRGLRVLLDDDLARVYGVTTKRLNQQARRNAERFPLDFLIHLSKQEVANLRMQFESSSWGGRRGTGCRHEASVRSGVRGDPGSDGHVAAEAVAWRMGCRPFSSQSLARLPPAAGSGCAAKADSAARADAVSPGCEPPGAPARSGTTRRIRTDRTR